VYQQRTCLLFYLDAYSHSRQSPSLVSRWTEGRVQRLQVARTVSGPPWTPGRGGRPTSVIGARAPWACYWWGWWGVRAFASGRIFSFQIWTHSGHWRHWRHWQHRRHGFGATSAKVPGPSPCTSCVTGSKLCLCPSSSRSCPRPTSGTLSLSASCSRSPTSSLTAWPMARGSRRRHETC
jgi:hypothetical protein